MRFAIKPCLVTQAFSLLLSPVYFVLQSIYPSTLARYLYMLQNSIPRDRDKQADRHRQTNRKLWRHSDKSLCVSVSVFVFLVGDHTEGFCTEIHSYLVFFFYLLLSYFLFYFNCSLFHDEVSRCHDIQTGLGFGILLVSILGAGITGAAHQT